MSKVPGMNRRAAAAIIRSIEGMLPAQDAGATGRDDESRAVAPGAPPSGTPTEVGVPDGTAESPAPAPSAPAADDGCISGQAAGAEGPRSLPADGAADPWRDRQAPPPDRAELGPRYGSLVAYPGAAQNAPRPDRDQGKLDDKRDETDGDKLALESQDDALTRKLDTIPTDAGVYLLKDKSGKVLYVGKAKSLRSRVRAYFRAGGDERFQVRFLMRRVRDFDTLVARSEKEALILENNLIKQYKPRYNIRLKDDKSYLSAKVTQHSWPRITVTRRIVKDGGRYFGPIGSADGLRETIDVIRKVFPLRTCSDAVFKNRSRPCIEYQIKRCLGPCCLPVDRDEYERHLHAAEMLLEFEEAARVRDRVRAIEKTVERQTVLHHWGGDQDVFGLYREGGFIEAIVLMVRHGKLTSTQSWSFQDLEFSDEDVLADLLTQYYSGARFVPDEIIVPVELEDASVRAELLSERRGRNVDFLVPQRGDKLRLLEMAMDNARQSFAARRDNENTREKMLEELRTKLHLRNTPKRMECYDISNLQGTMVVASQVTFDEGEPQKQLYRRYRMRTVDGQDDFASMYEVLSRRLKSAVADNEFPDLWVIDGGKGQLNVAVEVLKEHKLLDQVNVISIAKQHVLNDPRERSVVKSEERIFLPNRKDPIVLPRNSTALFLLVRIRDEAHRFAITYNRELRRRARLRSVLDDIEGIGPVRRRALLRYFGSLRRIREATVDELAAEIRRHLDMMKSLLDQEEKVEREEDRIAQEYLDAGNGQLQLLLRKGDDATVRDEDSPADSQQN